MRVAGKVRLQNGRLSLSAPRAGQDIRSPLLLRKARKLQRKAAPRGRAAFRADALREGSGFGSAAGGKHFDAAGQSKFGSLIEKLRTGRPRIEDRLHPRPGFRRTALPAQFSFVLASPYFPGPSPAKYLRHH